MNTTWSEASRFGPPDRRRSATAAIADRIRRRIVCGDLAPGSQLPGVRHLAKLYGVSVPTMHAALQCLATIGFVRASHGVGTFVTDVRSDATVLIHAWRQASTVELALMLSAIDERMPSMAAASITSSRAQPPGSVFDLALLAHERSMLRYADPEAFVAADLALHEAVARSVRGAEIIAACYRPIAERLLPALVADAEAHADDDLDEAHLRLANAIVDGSAPKAAHLARLIARAERSAVGATLG